MKLNFSKIDAELHEFNILLEIQNILKNNDKM